MQCWWLLNCVLNECCSCYVKINKQECRGPNDPMWCCATYSQVKAIALVLLIMNSKYFVVSVIKFCKNVFIFVLLQSKHFFAPYPDCCCIKYSIHKWSTASGHFYKTVVELFRGERERDWVSKWELGIKVELFNDRTWIDTWICSCKPSGCTIFTPSDGR